MKICKDSLLGDLNSNCDHVSSAMMALMVARKKQSTARVFNCLILEEFEEDGQFPNHNEFTNFLIRLNKIRESVYRPIRFQILTADNGHWLATDLQLRDEEVFFYIIDSSEAGWKYAETAARKIREHIPSATIRVTEMGTQKDYNCGTFAFENAINLSKIPDLHDRLTDLIDTTSLKPHDIEYIKPTAFVDESFVRLLRTSQSMSTFTQYNDFRKHFPKGSPADSIPKYFPVLDNERQKLCSYMHIKKLKAILAHEQSIMSFRNDELAHENPLIHYKRQMNKLKTKAFLEGLSDLEVHRIFHYKNTFLSLYPLHRAVAENDISKIKTLLNFRPALINSVDLRGFTPLHVAILSGNLTLIDYFSRGRTLINKKDDKGITPLHLAVLVGQLDAVQYLISNGAKIDIKDMNEQTPRDYAVGNDKTQELLQYLVPRSRCRSTDKRI